MFIVRVSRNEPHRPSNKFNYRNTIFSSELRLTIYSADCPFLSTGKYYHQQSTFLKSNLGIFGYRISDLEAKERTESKFAAAMLRYTSDSHKDHATHLVLKFFEVFDYCKP